MARPRRRVRRILVIGTAVLGISLVLVVCLMVWTAVSLHRVDVSSALSARGSRHGTNTLIVGTDSREGIAVTDPNASAFLGESVTGSRTDTIMVLHTEDSGSSLVSIPRDLWVTDPATGQKGRINSTYAGGPSDLVAAVTSLGIPVDHYIEIDFSGFGAMVDAVGGVTIEFPAPARDTHAGLSIASAGAHHLDGTTALAYVRSRYYEQQIDGAWKVDGTADLGRTQRQRSFLTALLDALVSTRSPISMVRLPLALRDGLRVDSRMGPLDMVDLARSVDPSELESILLPVTPRRTSGGADVLELQASAGGVIDGLAR